MISYRLPMRASRKRLAVWRVLKKLGVVKARQSLWIFPCNLWNRAVLKKIPGEIETWGGQSVPMASTILEERHERSIMVPVAAREIEAGPSERCVMAKIHEK